MILINGFNFPEPSADLDASDAFDQVRDSIRTRYEEQLGPMTFVEVRWDGLAGAGGIIRQAVGGVRIWTYAQANGYFVGMELRRMLAALPHDRPVRIVTHSLGGHVATAALWNVSSKLGGDVIRQTVQNGAPADGRYDPWVTYVNGFSDAAHRTPTHPDLRLGMIVPAMPGLTFAGGYNTDYYDRNVEGRAPVSLNSQGVYRTGPDWPVSTYDRIVVGQNEFDEVIRKFVGAAPVYGSTTLGSDAAEFGSRVAPFLNGHPALNSGIDAVAYRVNLRETYSGRGEKKHSWAGYLGRVNMPVFMDCLFLDVCAGPTVSSE